MLAYQSEIDALNQSGIQCPPADASASEKQAWRWVFNPITTDCIKPVADRNPKRLHNASDTEKCSCWALSMYATQSTSVAAFHALLKKHPKIKKLLGDHIALVKISSPDGLCTVVQRSGHFDFFPNSATNVASLMTVTASL